MENTQDTNKLVLGIINTETVAGDVIITSPLLPKALNTSLQVDAMSSIEFTTAALRMDLTNYVSKAILVKSTTDIVVIGLNFVSYSTDAFLAFPTYALGSDYFIVTCCTDVDDVCQFSIVSTGNNNTIMLTLPMRNITFLQPINHTAVYSGGENITITLQKYEVFFTQSKHDLTGIRIRSTYPVLVSSGNNVGHWLTHPNVDHGEDIMPPVKHFGQRFALVTNPAAHAMDYVWVLASEDGTTLSLFLAENTTKIIPRAGEAEHILLTTEFGSLYTDKPVMVVQFTCDDNPGVWSMFVVTPVPQYVTNTTVFALTTNEYFFNYAVIVVQKRYKDNVLLDTKNITAEYSWTPINGIDFVAARVLIGYGMHSISLNANLSNETSAGVGGYVFGRASTTSFAYPFGYELSHYQKDYTTRAITAVQVCQCKCTDIARMENVSTRTEDEIAMVISEMIQDMTVDSKTTSSSIRKKLSAADNRPSSTAIGVLGVIFLSLSFGLIVVVDIVTFLPSVLSTLSKLL
ncbi:hypothetical protein ACJMK2_032313 [Sinanodonta woodiana]|uniref:IgGFc-binding protein N-terminal domain-containing protein n=1 Tax=Sinanodonta woodiana TaxID=1069815 RepID=A0ABD3X1B6_SINWO